MKINRHNPSYRSAVCGVDAGVIMISDAKFANAEGAFAYPNGTYKCHWKIDKTWMGPVKGEDTVVVTSGFVAVGDPCYTIDRAKWSAFCDEMFRKGKPWFKKNGAVILDSMGGDGEYLVEFTMTKLPEA